MLRLWNGEKFGRATAKQGRSTKCFVIVKKENLFHHVLRKKPIEFNYRSHNPNVLLQNARCKNKLQLNRIKKNLEGIRWKLDSSHWWTRFDSRKKNPVNDERTISFIFRFFLLFVPQCSTATSFWSTCCSSCCCCCSSCCCCWRRRCVGLCNTQSTNVHFGFRIT